MKHLASVILMISVLFTTTSCDPGSKEWFEEFKDNPVVQSEKIFAIVHNIESVAEVTFAQTLPFLPKEQQTKYQEKFNSARLVLSKAIAAARSSISAAVESRGSKPDLPKILSDVSAAVLKIKEIVDEMRDLLKAGTSVRKDGFSPEPVLDKMVADFEKELSTLD